MEAQSESLITEVEGPGGKRLQSPGEGLVLVVHNRSQQW